MKTGDTRYILFCLQNLIQAIDRQSAIAFYYSLDKLIASSDNNLFQISLAAINLTLDNASLDEAKMSDQRRGNLDNRSFLNSYKAINCSES